MILYLLIGLIYWAVNSFVRKLETGGDWLLPVVWFLAWPLAFAAWAFILFSSVMDAATKWVASKRMDKHF